MIAVITSCINPKKIFSTTRSFFPLAERELQTINTLEKLKSVGFKQIILADNSDEYDFSSLGSAIDDVTIIHLKQYQFANKGINEILILLSILDYIPADTKIFKISGRYFPTTYFKLEMNDEDDFKVNGFDFDGKNPSISTRGYFVRNKMLYEEFLLACLNEIYSYPYRIVGLRSFWRFITEFIKPKLKTSSNISVEFAAARVLKNKNYKINLMEKIGIEGRVAGFQELNHIEE